MDQLKILVINRARDTERLQSAKAQLERMGLPFERIAAREAEDLTERAIAELVRPRLRRLVADLPGFTRRNETGPMVFMPEHHRYLVAAEVACYLSHQAAIDALIAAGTDGVIFEDDVAIDDDLPAVLDTVRALPDGARVVKLEGLHPAHRVHVCIAQAGRRTIAFMLKPTTGAAGYYLSREGAVQLRDHMRPLRGPYDAFLRQYWLHGVDVLEVVPFPVRQLPFPTTIPQRHAQALEMPLPLSRTAARAAATPCLKLTRLLRRTAALARRAHWFPRLRTGRHMVADTPQSG
jgi:glycosyl transferase family 25